MHMLFLHEEEEKCQNFDVFGSRSEHRISSNVFIFYQSAKWNIISFKLSHCRPGAMGFPSARLAWGLAASQAHHDYFYHESYKVDKSSNELLN